MVDLNKLSEELLLAVKKEEPCDDLLTEIGGLNANTLNSLHSSDQKIAFWINSYNAFYQLIAKKHQSLGKSIYQLKGIHIAQQTFSLDNIEHGILRRGKHKYSLGFFKNIFRYRHLKKYRPPELDYRIHFALNCGAISCPPIAFYSPDNLNEQLDLATSSFLLTEADIDTQTKTVHLSRLFLWFYQDFGGKKGISRIISRYLKQSINGYRLKYRQYDWTQSLGDFR